MRFTLLMALMIVVASVAICSPTSAKFRDVPPPQNVVLVTGSSISWSAPNLPPSDLLETSYLVYGKVKNQWEEVASTLPGVMGASIPPGYDQYGVVAIKHGVKSDRATPCVEIDPMRNPPAPTIRDECGG